MRLLLLSCSATKAETSTPIPAMDLYQGPLWQTFRRYDPGAAKLHVSFVSGHYGAGDARTFPMLPYDARMAPGLALAAAAALDGGRRDVAPGKLAWALRHQIVVSVCCTTFMLR